ncbi:hypothetical protein NPIL_561241 [Nephila pilipes]|uniref:Uncharacterized protein n=1 Tax=Nephila pilipes TaxID=299642 RepID=A0A8X6QW09_NEPPI|nr:hypothetical protein NPIL_561241 [Nephila pilipes]
MHQRYISYKINPSDGNSDIIKTSRKCLRRITYDDHNCINEQAEKLCDNPHSIRDFDEILSADFRNMTGIRSNRYAAQVLKKENQKDEVSPYTWFNDEFPGVILKRLLQLSTEFFLISPDSEIEKSAPVKIKHYSPDSAQR